MRERRFPPLLSAPSVVSAVFSLLSVGTGLFLLGNASPFWLMPRDPTMRVAFTLLLVVAACCAVALYIFVAPRMWLLSKLYTPAALGSQRLPDPLVTACLNDMDFACPVCTYNLRGLKQNACPECATPVAVYLYGTQRVSTKWTGLIICWLTLTFVASGVSLGSVWNDALSMLTGSRWFRGWYGGYSDLGVSAIAFTSLAGVLICAWRAIALAVPKPPHKQSISVRRTAVCLAAISAACALGIALIAGRQMLSEWY